MGAYMFIDCGMFYYLYMRDRSFFFQPQNCRIALVRRILLRGCEIILQIRPIILPANLHIYEPQNNSCIARASQKTKNGSNQAWHHLSMHNSKKSPDYSTGETLIRMTVRCREAWQPAYHSS